MKLRSPLQRFYANNGKTFILTQLFGENKDNLFYDSKGHRGLDFKTIGRFKWIRDYKQWKQVDRDEEEKEGYIRVVAAHDGILTTNFYYRAKQLGLGMFITSYGNNINYRTLYWHIESPWRSLAKWIAGKIPIFESTHVHAGSIIAVAGNSGFPSSSTGPHLHFELQRQEKYNGVWGEWESVDPIPYLQDGFLYQKDNKFFYNGKEVTALEAKKISSTIC